MDIVAHSLVLHRITAGMRRMAVISRDCSTGAPSAEPRDARNASEKE